MRKTVNAIVPFTVASSRYIFQTISTSSASWFQKCPPSLKSTCPAKPQMDYEPTHSAKCVRVKCRVHRPSTRMLFPGRPF